MRTALLEAIPAGDDQTGGAAEGSSPAGQQFSPDLVAHLDRLKQCKTTDPHFLRLEVAGLLEQLANAASDEAFARAARALFQQSPGRPPVNDSSAIAEAVFLFENGEVRSLRQAFVRVARRIAPYGAHEAVAERLRRKHARTKKGATKTF